MRNVLEYPITSNEVLEVLQRALDEVTKRQAIGGIDGLVLQQLKVHLEADPALNNAAAQRIADLFTLAK